MPRIHESPLKGANTVGTYGWLLDPKGGESGKPSAEDALAVARHTLNRDRKRQLPLIERQDPQGSPIDAAVSDIVSMVRAGRMSIDDLQATQSQETSRLRALKVMHGHNRDIERLAASTDVRARALDQIHRDPFIAVVAPQPATVAEANDCHNPAGSPDGGQFCSTEGGGPPKSWRDEPAYAGPRAPLNVKVRPKVRGDVSGFAVFGSGHGIGGVNIFVHKEETARAIQSAYKRGASSREIDDLIVGERSEFSDKWSGSTMRRPKASAPRPVGIKRPSRPQRTDRASENKFKLAAIRAKRK